MKQTRRNFITNVTKNCAAVSIIPVTAIAGDKRIKNVDTFDSKSVELPKENMCVMHIPQWAEIIVMPGSLSKPLTTEQWQTMVHTLNELGEKMGCGFGITEFTVDGKF